jgi:hypothetical protein
VSDVSIRSLARALSDLWDEGARLTAQIAADDMTGLECADAVDLERVANAASDAAIALARAVLAPCNHLLVETVPVAGSATDRWCTECGAIGAASSTGSGYTWRAPKRNGP